MHVLTCGTFDLFHPGHLFLLAQCRKLTQLTSISSTDGTNAGAVIVGLNPDDFAATYGKPAPVMSFEERRTMLEGCRYVDKVVENVHGNTMALLEEHRPGFLVIGQDWATRDYYTQIGVTQAELDTMGVSLLYVPRPADTLSSSEVKARVLDTEIPRYQADRENVLGSRPDQTPRFIDGEPVPDGAEAVVTTKGWGWIGPRPDQQTVSTAPRTAP